MNLADFLHTDTYSQKLQVTSIVIGWAWSNMDVAFKVIRDHIICCVSRMNGADFCMLISFSKAKSYNGYICTWSNMAAIF